jgi:hypothetical protein
VVGRPPRTSLPLASAEILASLAQHRVLSTPQLAAIHLPGRSERRARAVMGSIATAGLASFVAQAGAGMPRRLWFATERGAAAALHAGLLEKMPRLLDAGSAAGPLQAHTLAVNDVGIAFLAAARERSDEFGPLGWRHEVAHRIGPGRRAPMLIADALLTYLRLTGSGMVLEQRFCELDRATLTVDRLAAELARYADLYEASGKDGEPLWRGRYPFFPPVICVLAGAGREALRRRRDTAVALLRRTSTVLGLPPLSIRFCLAEDLCAQGPFAPIFTDVREPEKPVSWLVGGGGES